jgi:phosphoribosylamine--glycine ligase
MFHAGTRRDGDRLLTNGGRVLAVSARASDLKSAIAKAYRAVEKIRWDGLHYRKDIGKKGL